jgi:hypothetical protein
MVNIDKNLSVRQQAYDNAIHVYEKVVLPFPVEKAEPILSC